MPKRTSDFRADLLEDLANPQEAAHYLNAASEDSEKMVLVALRDIAEARQMARVAGEAGVAREALYRMLHKAGNPTYSSFMGILGALGLRLVFAPVAPTTNPIVDSRSHCEKSSGAKIGNPGVTGANTAVLQRFPDVRNMNGAIGVIARKQPTIEQVFHLGAILSGAAPAMTSLATGRG
jgi:probable addiction module antidote protein